MLEPRAWSSGTHGRSDAASAILTAPMSGLAHHSRKLAQRHAAAVLLSVALGLTLATQDLTAQAPPAHALDDETQQPTSPVRDALLGPRSATLAPLAGENRGARRYRYAVQDERVWIEPGAPEGTPSYELVFDFALAHPRITSFAESVEQYTEVSLLDEEIYPFAIEHLLLILPPTHPAHPCTQLDWSCEVAESDDAITDDSLRFTVDGTAEIPGGFSYSFDLEITLQMPEAIPVLFEDRASEHGYELTEHDERVPDDARFAPPDGFSRYEPPERNLR